jgi:hypothetical protein
MGQGWFEARFEARFEDSTDVNTIDVNTTVTPGGFDHPHFYGRSRGSRLGQRCAAATLDYDGMRIYPWDTFTLTSETSEKLWTF